MQNVYSLSRNIFLVMLLVLLTNPAQADFGESSVSTAIKKQALAKTFLNNYTWPLEKIIAQKDTWVSLQKEMEGMDSLEAWNFTWQNDILEFADSGNFDHIKLVQQDLNHDQEEDVFVILDESTSLLFIKKGKRWKKTWEHWNDTGNPARIEKNDDHWLRTTEFEPCSDCSRDHADYYKVLKDTVIPVAHLYWAYNTTHASPDKAPFVYDQCDASWTFSGDTLIVNFYMKMMEEETELCFLEQDVVIHYLLNAENQLGMIRVAPAELKPFAEHWNRTYRESTEAYEYSPNHEILMACLDFHADYLYGLKENPKYRKMVERLEDNYDLSWKEIASTAFRTGRY